MFAVCKTLHSEVLRCRTDAGGGEGAGDAQVAVRCGAGRQPQYRACAHKLGACAHGPRAGQASGMFRDGSIFVICSGKAPVEAEARLAGDLLREAAIPRSPQGLPASCLPASPGGIHLN